MDKVREQQEPVDEKKLLEESLNFVTDIVNKRTDSSFEHYNNIGDGIWNNQLFDCNDLSDAYEAGYRQGIKEKHI